MMCQKKAPPPWPPTALQPEVLGMFSWAERAAMSPQKEDTELAEECLRLPPLM